jgi:1,2-phenylacetyl-CoA epoxidase catalytic subunit
MRREEVYHLLHAEAWIKRLADGPARERLAGAVAQLWPDAQEVFAPLAEEELLVRDGLLPESMAAMHRTWQATIRPALERIAGALPDATPSVDGRSRRTEEFAWLHAEMTSVARSEAEAVTW